MQTVLLGEHTLAAGLTGCLSGLTPSLVSAQGHVECAVCFIILDSVLHKKYLRL